MLYVLFRIAFAVILATFISKLLFKLWRTKDLLEEERKRNRNSREDCIDICPECGHVREPHHRCP